MVNKVNLIALCFVIAYAKVNSICDYDWISYKQQKCIKYFDVLTPYDEAEVYCHISFGATLLELDTVEEQRYFTFHLLRLLKLENNVWLKKSANSDPNLLWHSNRNWQRDCIVMLSISGAQNKSLNVGKLETQRCHGLNSFVCQKVKIAVNHTIIEINNTKKVNDYYTNKNVTFNNSETSLITGIYYKFINKQHNKSFSLSHFGNAICSSNYLVHRFVSGYSDCSDYYPDPDVSIETNSNSFLFIEHNGAYRIKEKNTLKELVIYNNNAVRLFKCSNERKQKFCDKYYNSVNISYLWNVVKIEETNSYQIRDHPQNRFTLGLSYWKPHNGINMASLAVYEYNTTHSTLNTQWNFDFDNLLLFGELYDIELTDNIERLISKHITHIDLMETVSVINDSPANLDHVLSVTKDISESFTTRLGESQRYLDSFSLRREQNEEFSKSNSQSVSVSNSLADTVSKTISNSIAHTKSLSESSSMSRSNSKTNSASDSQTSGRSSTKSKSNSETSGQTIGVSASVSAGFFGIGASVSTNYESSSSQTSEQSKSETNEKSRTNSKERGESQSIDRTNSNEISETDTVSQEFSLNSQLTRDRTNQRTNDQTYSKSNIYTSGNEVSKQNEISFEKTDEFTNTKTHTYRIDKTLQVPPFSAIKISSFVNFVEDLKFSYKILFKFSANAFRRKKDGTNEWSTLDSDAVKLILLKSGFRGEVYDQNDEYIYVKIFSSFKGSFGIESYFVAKEIDRSLT